MSDHILLLPPSNAPSPPRFRLLRTGIVLHSYQLYAVERWITSRDKYPLLVVYTGHQDHSLVLDAYAPLDTPAWNDAIVAIRANGARPKNTPHGTLMLTSLAHFRSDYTIVPIPAGDYLAVQDQLYANINLLRMGCSGRSALTLEDPSEATKDRFISSYFLPENTFAPYPASSEHLPLPSSTYSSPNRHTRQKPRNLSTSSLPARKDLIVGRTKDRPAFVATVLEFVKLIQAALAIFGIYPVETSTVSPNLLIDGLLCETTLQGVKLWTSRIGVPCVDIQPTDRIIDPSFVAALLSLVLATRNRLAYLGYSLILPRDPFLCPYAFATALTTYLQSTAPPPVPAGHHSIMTFSTPHGSVHISAPLIPPAPPPTTFLSAAAATAATAATASTLPVGAILTREIVDTIATQYDHRTRTESRKVRRVLKGKRAAAQTVDSDGADGGPPETRMHTLSLSLSLSGGEESPSAAQGGAGKSQLLSGLASGLRGGSAALANVGVNVGGGAVDPAQGDPGAITVATRDIAAFVLLVAGTGRPGGAARRAKRVSREGTLEGLQAEDGGVGASVRALWSGRVGELVRMREDVDGGAAVNVSPRERRSPMPLVASDGEESNARSYDGRSTEEDSEPAAGTGAFGGMWSGRVRGKLGTWAGGLSRKKQQSVDLGGTSTSPPGPSLIMSQPVSNASSQQSQATQEPSPGRPQPGRLVIGGSPSILNRRVSGTSRAVSPTLPPMAFSLDGIDREMDDDDLLSSGQVSPLSDDRPNPFSMTRESLAASSTRLAGLSAQELVRGIGHARRGHLRMVQSARVASWAGRPSGGEEDDDAPGRPSVASDEDGESDAPAPARRRRPTQARFHSLLSVVDHAGVRGEAVLASEDEDEDGDESAVSEAGESDGHLTDDEGAARRRAGKFDPRRRRSFHDLDTYRKIGVLSAERMAIDVELCGQLLTTWRREEHLRNVIACVKLFSDSLAQTSTRLRAHHDTHAEAMQAVERSAHVLGALDTANAAADKLAQATHTLRYESEQFRVDDLWATARAPRRTVLDMRARVHGAGSRRLPAGVHGAHGAFTRLQRGLDGEARLVDHLGRTEGEASEEAALEALGAYLDEPANAREAAEGADAAPTAVASVAAEDEGAVVAHPGIKPMWLLRFFTRWGARWSAAPAAASVTVPTEEKKSSPEIPHSAPVVATGAAAGVAVQGEKIARPASH